MAGNLVKHYSREKLWELIEDLPAESLIEVRQFVEFLRFKQSRAVEQLRTPEQNSNIFGWLPGFFEKVIGGWQGEPLVREDQGKYEARDELK